MKGSREESFSSDNAKSLNETSNEQISDYKHRKDHTRNPIGGHKGQVNPAQVLRFYNGMLVNQAGNKHQDPCPVKPAKFPQFSSRHYHACTQQVQ